jgi:hypothetical protein
VENNQAFVAVLKNIQPIEGADRIVCADIVLNGVKQTQVVVGVDAKEDTPVVYFDSNMALSDRFVEDMDKESPDYGKPGFHSFGAYLAKGNRVRVVKLKGVISNGLAVELNKFNKYLKLDEILHEGYSFTSLDGIEICHKWLPPVKPIPTQGKKKGRSGKTISRMIPGQFHFHIDTDQLPRNLHKLQPDQIISISRKIHGTSAIVSKCLVKKPLTLVSKIAVAIGISVVNSVYDYVYASRTVVKNDCVTKGFYGTDIWTDAGKKYFEGKLHDGETVYYEIVGYLPNSSSMIQKGYPYGCKQGEYKVAVYRITKTGPDGDVVEYSWQAMKERCVEIQVPMVEEYDYGRVSSIYADYTGWNCQAQDDWRNRFMTNLKSRYLDKDAKDCNNNPDEGIVIRIEGKDIQAFKYKSEKFLLKESKAKEEEVVDIEEDQQNEVSV